MAEMPFCLQSEAVFMMNKLFKKKTEIRLVVPIQLQPKIFCRKLAPNFVALLSTSKENKIRLLSIYKILRHAEEAEDGYRSIRCVALLGLEKSPAWHGVAKDLQNFCFNSLTKELLLLEIPPINSQNQPPSSKIYEKKASICST